MWQVTVFRDNGYSTESFTKTFQEEDEAYDFFSDEVKVEFDDEIAEGMVSDQEIQNIIDSGIYIYENDKYEVNITLEVAVEDELIEDDDLI